MEETSHRFAILSSNISEREREREATLSSNLSSVLTRKAPRGHAVGRGNSPETLLPRCSTVSSINLLAWFTPLSLFLTDREKKSRYSISTFGARTRQTASSILCVRYRYRSITIICKKKKKKILKILLIFVVFFLVWAKNPNSPFRRLVFRKMSRTTSDYRLDNTIILQIPNFSLSYYWTKNENFVIRKNDDI